MILHPTDAPAPTAATAEADDPPASGDPAEALVIQRSPQVTGKIDIEWIRERLAAALAEISKASARPVARVNVLITDDARMIELNRTHADLGHTTDVLSFDLSDGEPTSSIHAEIAVCADEAGRRAAELRHPVERELLLYSIHGVLHCAGFDDQTDAGFNAMHAEEDRILKAIGVGATFDAGGDRT